MCTESSVRRKGIGNLRGEMTRAFGRNWAIASCLMLLPFFLENVALLPMMFTEQVDSMQAMINYLYKGAMMPFTILCATIPYATSFLVDQKNGSLKHVIHRSGRLRFSRDRFIANALAGASAVAFSQLLLFMFFCIVFPYPDIGYRYFPTGNAWEALFYNQSGFYTLAIIGLHFLANMAWSSLALATSTYLKNTYLTLFVPFILVNVLSAIATTEVLDRVRSLVFLIYGIDFWRDNAAQKLLEYGALFLAIIVFSYIVFWTGVRRSAARI